MKKSTIVVGALVLAASAANAESVTIQHMSAGALESELLAAIEAAENLTSLADITELKITGEADVNEADLTFIRANMKTTLTYIDLSEATLAGNKLPGGQWDGNGKAFNGMTELVEVVLPASITTLGGGSFFGCTKLERVNLNDNIRVIPSKCFMNCSKLVLDRLPANLTTIEAEAFRGCSSLTIGGEMPETLTSIRNFAFCESKVAFTKLPSKLDNLEQNAFQKSNVSFTELPAGVKALRQSVFAGTKVNFTTLPATVTTVDSYVFQSVKTMPEFTIPNQANLWTKIPIAFFFVATDDVERTFICRAPSAPSATVNVGKDKWTGSFSQVAENPNTTFKVLASAAQSFKTTAPYNTMNIEILTTEVEAPLVNYEGAPEHIVVKFVMDKPADYAEFDEHFPGYIVEHTSFEAVPEGEGHLEISFNDAAFNGAYVKEIRWANPSEPEAYADEAETETPGEEDGEEVDPDLLYACSTPDGNMKKTVSVPVTVTPGMRPLSVEIGRVLLPTGIESVEAPAATVSRRGDILTLSVAGGRLYDVTGRLVASTDTNTLDLNGLPAGVYILNAHKASVKILK